MAFPVTEVWETGGLPAVYAHWPAADPAAPRVLVYGHHDVQPAELGDGWDYEPFQPLERDGRIFGRGASDDKGQVLFHVLGVRAALASGAQAPPVTLTLLIEGEEESGSPNFARLLADRAAQLSPDVIVISDTTMWAAGTPSICTGMRGLAEAQVSVEGPDRDLHSGSFGGGVPNPAHVLARLLAGLHDADGRVTLPRFYDDVVPLSEPERELLARPLFDEQAWLRDAGMSPMAYGEAGFSTLERIWARPTAEVNGLWGGHTGAGGKTIVPRSAHAKLSFRLVADQEPAKVIASLTRYLEDFDPNGCVLTVTAGHGVRPCRSAIDAPAVAAARRAMGRAFKPSGCLPRRAAAVPRRTWPTFSGRRWSSWPSVLTRTGSTHPTSTWISPGSSRALKRSRTCGKSSPQQEISAATGKRATRRITFNGAELDDGLIGRLALSRSGVDRATGRREDTAWIEAAWSDPGTRVLVLRDAQALVARQGRAGRPGVRAARAGPRGDPVPARRG